MKKHRRKKSQKTNTRSIITNHSNTSLPAKICLSIIVKNESQVIERMLNSVYPILDYYCIVDTGSTDGTQEIITNFFNSKGIEGILVQHEWKNFEDARNKALQETKKFLNDKKVENGFGYWQDADEELIIPTNFNINTLKNNLSTYDGANILINYGSQNYYRTQFFNISKDWRWYGPVHEVLICDGPIKIAPIEGISVLVRSDGNSWVAETIQQKYEGHAKILENYVANDEKKDPRWLFYLAQSYRDAGGEENLKKSLYWYEKRANTVDGYWEENYFSALMAANIKSKLNYSIEEVINSFLLCGKHNKWRIEHLVPVILHYQSIKEFDLAYIYGLRAIQCDGKLPMPNSSLFVDREIYQWKIFDIHALSCWYSGRKEESKEIFKKLMKAVNFGLVPESQYERIKQNQKYFQS